MVSLLESQRVQGDSIALAPSDVPTVEIAWRDGSASHWTAGGVLPDPRIRVVSGANTPEIPVPELKRLAGINRATNKPTIARRMLRAVTRFCIAALIGVGATLAWQTHGDQGSEIINAWAASLRYHLAASTTKSASEITLTAAQAAPPAPAANQDALPQSQPGPQITSASTGKPVPAAASMQQLDVIARNLALVQKGIEQLSAQQEEMARNIATLQAAERDIRSKLSPAPSSKAVPLPPRKKIVSGVPAQPSVPSPTEPTPTPVARPPVSLDPTR